MPEHGSALSRRWVMTVDAIIRVHMTAAGMLMEDLSAKVILDPLSKGRTQELRELASVLIRIADIVEAIQSKRS
jgi:hypothetical protein